MTVARTQCLATAGLLIALLALAPPCAIAATPTTEAERKTLQANESPESLWTEGDWWRDPNAYERNWERMKARGLRYYDPKHYAWGQERNPGRSVIILDPPLPRTIKDDSRVQVEWFYTILGEDGKTETATATASAIVKWAETLRPQDPDGVPITRHYRLVGTGPTLLRQDNARRRIAQELLYAYQNGTDWRYEASGASVHRAMYTNPDIFESRATAQAAIERLGLSGAHWRNQIAHGNTRTESRIKEANRRFLQLMTQAQDHAPRALRTPWDPILLIDGKYLLTGGLIPRIDLLLQTANRIIRLQTEKLGQSHVHGRPTIIDGDELVVQGQRIRLTGIRVPPNAWCARYGMAQCAARARRQLKNLARNRRFMCVWPHSDTVAAGAQPARCEFRVHELKPCRDAARCSVSKRMVGAGWALAATIDGEFGELEHKAARLRRGMWRYIPATARNDAPRNLPPTPLEALMATNRSAIAWGNEQAPGPATILVLDPPLPRSDAQDAVELELYSTMIDDDGASHTDQCARELVLKFWWPSIEKAKAPVSLTHRLVDEGPGLDNRHHESRRRIAELVIGGAWYMNQDDERGLTVITKTLEHLQTRKVRQFTETDMKDILTAAGIKTGEWEDDAKEEIDTARTGANARWSHLAHQYLERLGRTARTATPLGRGASPIIVIDGRYLMTMTTTWRQRGLKATTRLFQTANSVIRHRIETNPSGKTETRENDKEENTMNYTAAALATAIVLGGACGTGTTNEAAAGEFPNWKGKWERDRGTAEVVDEAHIRMKDSGRVFRILGIGRLEDPEQARIAKDGIAKLVEGKKLDCQWLPGPAAEGNPMAAAPDGTPFSTCGVRMVNYATCRRESCLLPMMVVTNGYGIPEGGAWEQRSPNATKAMGKLKAREAEARHQKIGLWTE